MELGIKYLIEAAIKCHCDTEVTTKALIFHHHFMQWNEATCNHIIVAAAALHLSSKVCEKLLDIGRLIHLFYHIVNKSEKKLSSTAFKFRLLSKTLKFVDHLLIRALNFKLNPKIAQQFLIPFLNALAQKTVHPINFQQTMGNTCLKLMSDFYTKRVCLNYEPDHIAVACIDVALNFHAFRNNLQISSPWHEGFCSDLTDSKLEEIQLNLLKMYRKKGKTYSTAVRIPPENIRLSVQDIVMEDVKPNIIAERTLESDIKQYKLKGFSLDGIRPSAQVEDILSSTSSGEYSSNEEL
ncbi:uncharacterized protein CDAR_572591 [Caerostris darwini]|uniref:Cyclin J n=1 Tax=Caerostris darwini TaxID=1538125 RepID=A0AAV4VRX9_9ARAC|nr:uncharacterized protein CDAR_572591 [Caerostris darwini]